jgi:transcriptional regulator with XRE-family HTH domain
MSQGYGRIIREERVRQHLSQGRLAELAGISRRHLASLEKEANVSIDLLRAVATALGITDIGLGEGLTAHSPAAAVQTGRLLRFAEGIEIEARRLTSIAAELRSIAGTGVGKSVRNDTPSPEVSDEVAQLVDLMVSFARDAGALSDGDTIRFERDAIALLRKRSNTA